MANPKTASTSASKRATPGNKPEGEARDEEDSNKKTEKIEKTSPLQREHERLLSLVNSMADGVIAVNAQGKIELYNGAALDVLDINVIESGHAIESVLKLYNDREEKLDTKDIITKTSTRVISRDYKLHYSDGSIASIYFSIAPVYANSSIKGPDGFIIIIRDISREKSLEEERDEFISVVSHELRTPVAVTEGAIGNALYLAKKGVEVSQLVQSLENAHKQAMYLEDMINDLSTLSRAERHVLDNSIEAINIHEFVESLHAAYEKQATEKGLLLQTAVDPHLELVHSIKLYLQEILQNFITNAIKYTDRGSVLIEAKKSQNGVEFHITDTGIGIGKADQGRVFDKFWRAENHETRQQNGTGLGLHVTKKLAQLAKAEMTLQSELGKGSTFSIYFPNLN